MIENHHQKEVEKKKSGKLSVLVRGFGESLVGKSIEIEKNFKNFRFYHQKSPKILVFINSKKFLQIKRDEKIPCPIVIKPRQ